MEIYGNKITCDLDDISYIKEQLAKLPRKQLMTGVINSYNKVYQDHDNTLKGIGAARREANSRLRRYINRLMEAQR